MMPFLITSLLLILFIPDSCPDELPFLPQPPVPVPERTICNAAWDPQHPTIYPDDFDGEPDQPSSAAAARRPSGHQSGGSDRTPIRIKFIITPSTTLENEYLLRKAFLDINKKLSDILKAPILSDIRFPRFRRFRGDACHFPQTCATTLVPAEFHLPCVEKINGRFGGQIVEKHVPIVTPEMVSLLNEENVNTMVYVSVFTAYLTNHGCTPTSLAYASLGYADESTTYPSHGRIVFCSSPLKLGHKLYTTLLHETLHVLSSLNVLGYMAPQYLPQRHLPYSERYSYLNRMAIAENQTWRKYTHKWKRKGNILEQFTTRMAATPNVLRVVKEYFNCVGDVMPGAEVSRHGTGTVRQLGNGHWSERLFPDEILSPLYNPGSVLSRLTLAMLQDTGWYDVDMSKGEPLEHDVANRRAQYPMNMCYVALKSCDEIFDIFRAQAERAYTLRIPWVGAYCDPTGEIATRACTHDGKTRLHCNSNGYWTDGCAVYMKTEDMDSRPMECAMKTVHPQTRTWMRQNGLSLVCVSFPRFYADLGKWIGGSKTINTPRCMIAQCDRANRGIQLYNPLTGGSRMSPPFHGICSSNVICRQNETTFRDWPRNRCSPPYEGSQVCPYYPDVCEATGGAGAPPRLVAEKKEGKQEGTSGSIRIESSNFELGIVMLLVWYVIMRERC